MFIRCLCMAVAVILFHLCTPGGPAPWLAWVAMVPFFAALWTDGRGAARRFGPPRRVALRNALLAGGYAFFGWLVSIWWAYVGMRCWLEMNPVWAVLSVVGLAAYSALPYAAYGALHARLGNGMSAPVAQAALLVALEGVFPQLLPGKLAHALYTTPLFLQPLELGGMPLLFFLVLLVNALLARGAVRRVAGVRHALRPALAGVLVLGCMAGYGVARLAAYPAGQGGDYRIAVIQPAIPVHGRKRDVPPQDRDNGFASARRRSAELLARERAAGTAPDLVLWPETPGWLDCGLTSVDAFKNYRLVEGSDTWLMTQCARKVEGGVHNAAVLHAPDRRPAVAVYAKRVLLPFGEYLPLEDRLPWLRALLPGVRHFVRGGAAVPLDAGGARLVPALCYEAGFADHVRGFHARGAVLTVLSDDAWFGNTPGMDWNFALAVPRTVENRMPMVRAANTGVSAVVDAAGRVVAQLPRGRSGKLVADVAPGGGDTPYARWGDWFLWLCCGAGLAGLLWPARRTAFPR